MGKPIAWAYFSNNWFKGIKFPSSAIRSINRTGAVPFIRLMPRANFDINDTTYSLQKIIDGKFDPDLIRWAQNEKKLGIPLMMEFAGEPNGDWFSWSGPNNGGGQTDGYGDPSLPDGPERYRDAYRHIIDLFRSQGADNITWVFHVNSASSPTATWNSMAAYYPGDDYIDWIGESAYGAQVMSDQWELLNEVIDSSYQELSGISTSKPLALLEYGVIDDHIAGHKAEWIRQGLDSIRVGKYPRLKGISYWHSKFRTDLGTISNMRLDSSPDVLAAYKTEIADSFFVSRVQLSNVIPSVANFVKGGNIENGYVLNQNYPNPFNPKTIISFEVPRESMVRLVIYNAIGQEILGGQNSQIVDEGIHQVTFDGTHLASGIYFYRIEAADIQDPTRTFAQTKKMMLVK